MRGFDDKVDIDVAMLQQKLQLVVGKECCKVDGIYGPRTTKAVAMFFSNRAWLHGATAVPAVTSSTCTIAKEAREPASPQVAVLLMRQCVAAVAPAAWGCHSS